MSPPEKMQEKHSKKDFFFIKLKIDALRMRPFSWFASVLFLFAFAATGISKVSFGGREIFDVVGKYINIEFDETNNLFVMQARKIPAVRQVSDKSRKWLFHLIKKPEENSGINPGEIILSYRLRPISNEEASLHPYLHMSTSSKYPGTMRPSSYMDIHLSPEIPTNYLFLKEEIVEKPIPDGILKSGAVNFGVMKDRGYMGIYTPVTYSISIVPSLTYSFISVNVNGEWVRIYCYPAEKWPFSGTNIPNYLGFFLPSGTAVEFSEISFVKKPEKRKIISSRKKSDIQKLERDAKRDLESLYKLGEAHYYGRETPVDFYKAAKCWKTAARKGHLFAEFRYAMCRALGRGTPQDPEKAYKTLKRISQKNISNFAGAQFMAEWMRTFQMGLTELDKARNRAADKIKEPDYFLRPGVQGWAQAMLTRGFFIMGEKPENDLKLKNNYSYNDTKKDENHSCSLSGVYILKYGDPGGNTEAIDWFKGAAARGSALARAFWLIERSGQEKPWTEKTKNDVREEFRKAALEMDEKMKTGRNKKRKRSTSLKKINDVVNSEESQALIGMNALDHPLASYYKGVLLNRANRPGEALKTWEKEKENPACLYRTAIARLENEHDFKKAAKKALEAQELSDRKYLKVAFESSRDTALAIFDYRERELKLYNFDPVKIYFISNFFEENAPENYKNGIRALVREKNKKAFNYFSAAAKNGDAHSSFCCGLTRFYGIGIKKDRKKALEYFKIASSKGNINAMIFAGTMQYFGIDSPQRPQPALALFLEAAKNSVLAKYALAYDLDNGNNTIRNPQQKAFETFLQLAEGKTPQEAYFKLGERYFSGNGCKRSFQKALECFEKAAKGKYVPALYKLGDIYYQGKGVPASRKKASEYWEKALSLDGEEPDKIFTNNNMENFIVPFQVLDLR